MKDNPSKLTEKSEFVFPEEDKPTGKPRTQHSAKGLTGSSATAPRVYGDKYGLPVMHDAVTHEQTKQTKADAISVLWHELLSPVTLIKAYTTTLLQLNHVITEEQKEQYLQGIDAACGRVVRSLENLRDVTRLEEIDDINVESISLFDLLRHVVSEMQKQTMKHVIKIRRYAPLPHITVDPKKIEMVINNLLANAIKYSPYGGDIEVEIRMVRDEQELRRMFGDVTPARVPCLGLSVADAGIGIPESELGQIFQKFYRVDNKLTRTIPGAGLGLYICKIIVKAHGGHIWARNRLQGGCIFSFFLPLDFPAPGDA